MIGKSQPVVRHENLVYHRGMAHIRADMNGMHSTNRAARARPIASGERKLALRNLYVCAGLTLICAGGTLAGDPSQEDRLGVWFGGIMAMGCLLMFLAILAMLLLNGLHGYLLATASFSQRKQMLASRSDFHGRLPLLRGRQLVWMEVLATLGWIGGIASVFGL